ncbi:MULTISPECIES: NtaA/DmoA family FMN-dependent monooxygenase [Bacillus]|uniref:Nitrilotriacetate monooxygenase family FMN-dependent oxidoreductase n=1 Tax=Bacillus cereus VD048 TaxID=1053226 RepID=J8HSK4_BACCE|nr:MULTISPECIES: NtaA/DmoA family FMN-dependent monooxygenase [Bacillus]EJR30648.1 nitrilotriacetate monooxygenase family FMN-dependent oxidoreductase [Bacillus cereus VD048]MBK5425372.1 NtaA/DmoA family FMN-dependent monooxygenase [Bacillus sp. TH30]WJE36431.1 NtaA/DmoA family FMN-dependent monooxygenase [Bacillus mycoides]WOA65140.1 NtaA/DmoA family FMN-dependent monooxygenase [Bacillus mycoides]
MSIKKQLCIGLCLISRKKEQENKFDSGIDEQVELARLAEKAKLDFVFKADYLVAHPDLIARNKGNVILDPTLLFTAIAYATEKIGVVTTASTSFYPPYILARQLQSLNWISNGRVGWNIVTSIDGAENFGETGMPPSEERYAKAAECTELVRKLWRSHPYEVLKEDNADVIREMVQPIEHSGEHFEVKGPLNVPQHISGEMPLFQAGASDPGRNFAASVADAIFAAMPDIETGIELRQDLRRRSEQHGRTKDAIRVLPGLYFFIGDTYEEALEMHRQAHQHLTKEKRFALLEMVLGLDVRGIPLESKVTEDMLPSRDQTVRSKTHAELLRNFIIKNEPTVEQILERPEVVGSAHWVAIGTPQDVCKQIMERFEAGALDGFIAIPGGPPKSLDLFFSEVIPLFVRAGVFREEYTGSTLREHLEGNISNALQLK